MKKITEKGMTLIELTVVLLILVALAGLVVPYVGGTSRKALCDATDVSMQNIKSVIMNRYYLDTLGYFPKDTKAGSDYSLHYLFTQPATQPTGWNNFDIDSQVGWRGPYLQNGMTLDAAASLHSSFTSTTTYTNKVFANGDSIVLDAWGRPFVLQVIESDTDNKCWGVITSENFCARLVSAGKGHNGPGLFANSGGEVAFIETTESMLGQNSDQGDGIGDDRLLYLNIPTPPGDENTPCSLY